MCVLCFSFKKNQKKAKEVKVLADTFS